MEEIFYSLDICWRNISTWFRSWLWATNISTAIELFYYTLELPSVCGISEGLDTLNSLQNSFESRIQDTYLVTIKTRCSDEKVLTYPAWFLQHYDIFSRNINRCSNMKEMRYYLLFYDKYTWVKLTNTKQQLDLIARILW